VRRPRPTVPLRTLPPKKGQQYRFSQPRPQSRSRALPESGCPTSRF
jgi:hypothetical protein